MGGLDANATVGGYAARCAMSLRLTGPPGLPSLRGYAARCAVSLRLTGAAAFHSSDH